MAWFGHFQFFTQGPAGTRKSGQERPRYQIVNGVEQCPSTLETRVRLLKMLGIAAYPCREDYRY